MNSSLFKIIAFLFLTSIAGCAINRFNDPRVFQEIKEFEDSGEAKQYSHDFSNNRTMSGELVLIAQPNPWQLGVKEYQFEIEGQRVSAFKCSVSTIRLGVGEHKIKGWVRAFGFSVERNFTIEDGKKTYLIFRGPMDMLAASIFWRFDPTANDGKGLVSP